MTTERTEGQIQKEREAVAAMKHAQANMSTALNRIYCLESALELAANRLENARNHIGPDVYQYNGGKTVHSLYEGYAAEARKAL